MSTTFEHTWEINEDFLTSLGLEKYQAKAVWDLVAPSPRQAESLKVVSILETGEWGLEKIIASDMLTDEYNKSNQWMVLRKAPPYCCPNGHRIWSGATPMEAFAKAMTALNGKKKKK